MIWKSTVLMTALAMASPAAAAPVDIPRPNVPANLEVPLGYTPFLVAHAGGTQNYVCVATAGGVAWSFFGPQATLFNHAQAQVMTHYLSANPAENNTPRATWQHSGDSSAAWAAAIASSTNAAYVAPGAIPWLLLQVVGVQYGPLMGEKMVRTAFIQRVNTAGGLAPPTGCAAASDAGKKALVPYTTDYVFYR
jgi:hypothetical protein